MDRVRVGSGYLPYCEGREKGMRQDVEARKIQSTLEKCDQAPEQEPDPARHLRGRALRNGKMMTGTGFWHYQSNSQLTIRIMTNTFQKLRTVKPPLFMYSSIGLTNTWSYPTTITIKMQRKMFTNIFFLLPPWQPVTWLHLYIQLYTGVVTFDISLHIFHHDPPAKLSGIQSWF